MEPNADPVLERLDRAVEQQAPPDRLLALVLEAFAADGGTLHRLAEDSLELVASSAGMPESVLERIRDIPVGKGMAGLAVERRAPVRTCNLQDDRTGDVQPGARATGLLGSICVPLFAGERVVGTLGIGNRQERDFAPAEVALLIEAGRRIARALCS